MTYADFRARNSEPGETVLTPFAGIRAGPVRRRVTAVEDWLAYLRQRGRSATTLRTYASIMSTYPADPLGVTVDQAEAWWATQDRLSAPTRSRNLMCLRSFYRWATRFDLTDRDPTRRLDPPHQGNRLPRPIGRADLLAVLKQCDLEDAHDMRRAVALGAYAGLRVSEAAALTWTDVDRETGRLYVRGKGDKDRGVALPPLLLDELLPVTGGNVVTGQDRAYSADALQRRVNRLIVRAGVDATFHRLRARYATVGLAKTGNLLAMSRALGHASVVTTGAYAATSDSDLDLIGRAATEGM